MAFKGDFEKLDDEIKVQLKALKDNDIETVRKIHAQTMSGEDQQLYLMTEKEKKDLYQIAEE